MHKHPPICVLGMHRSGTSLTTGILKLLGLYLGPDAELIPPNYGNPSGFWEHQKFIQYNDQILTALGGSWHEPPLFPPGWEHTPQFADIRHQVRFFLGREFQASTLWGWKDPRTCLTAPLWKQLIPSLQCVLCLRDPLDVARSLHHRDGFCFAKCIHLWLHYTIAALTHSDDNPRVFIFYEDFIEEPRIGVQRLAGFLDHTADGTGPAVQDAIRRFIDSRPQHRRSRDLEASPQARTTVLARAFYCTLQIYAKLEAQPLSAGSATVAQLQNTIQHFGHYCIQAQKAPDQVQKNAEHDAHQLAILSQAIGRLSQELARREEVVRRGVLTDTQDQPTLSVQEAQILQATLTAKQDELTRAKNQLGGMASRTGQQTQVIQQLQHQLVETQPVRTQQVYDLQQLRRQRQTQETRHMDAQATAEAQIANIKSLLSSLQAKGIQAAAQLDIFCQRRINRILARIRPERDLSPTIAPAFQQLKDDSLLFTPDLRGFRLQPSVNLARVPFLAYPLNLQRKNLCGVLLAVTAKLPLREGEFGIEIISPAQTIVAQQAIACPDIEAHVPTCIILPVVPDTDQSGFGLRVFARSNTTPVRIFEWQKYTWGKAGSLQTRPFCGFLFK